MFKKILVGVVALSLVASAVLATVTPTGVKHTTFGNKRVTYGTLIVTGAPTSLGYALTAANVGLSGIERLIIYPNYDYPDVDWTYAPTTASTGYLVPMRQGWLDKKQILLAGTTDSIRVTTLRGDDFEAAGLDTELVLIKPLSGSLARLYAALPTIATGANATTGLQDNVFSATGGLTLGAVSDTGLTVDGPVLRATNTTGSWYRGDTLYFLPGVTDGTSRLAYSGRATLGAAVAGTYSNLYVPFGLGNYIKVIKKTGAQLYAANAIPVYYVPNGALGAKFVANQYVAATPIRGGKHAAEPIVVDRVPTTSSGFTSIIYFMAIGN